MMVEQLVCIKVKRRTLRRRQRAALLADYSSDLDKILVARDKAICKIDYLAYDRLYDIVYKAYIEILDSEV